MVSSSAHSTRRGRSPAGADRGGGPTGFGGAASVGDIFSTIFGRGGRLGRRSAAGHPFTSGAVQFALDDAIFFLCEVILGIFRKIAMFARRRDRLMHFGGVWDGLEALWTIIKYKFVD